MKLLPLSNFLRIFFTILFLVFLVFFISPGKIYKTIIKCDLRWIFVALSLLPVFIAARIGKWFLLIRQIDANVTLSKIIPGYFWGMALGLITPGRLGELARIQGMEQSGKCAGLFFLEKSIEVGCLLALCLMAITILNFVPWWLSLSLLILLTVCAVAWRKFLIFSIQLSGKKLGKPSFEKLEKIEWVISNLKITGCTLLSFAYFLIFIIQIYIILLSMGTAADPLIMPLVPLVLLTNLVPITVGGYGVRETAAVFLFKSKYIKEAVAASSVGLATFFNLVLPAFIGTGIHFLQKSLAKFVTRETDK
jgi:uncharacterized protein (TIRG00374 family)